MKEIAYKINILSEFELSRYCFSLELAPELAVTGVSLQPKKLELRCFSVRHIVASNAFSHAFDAAEELTGVLLLPIFRNIPSIDLAITQPKHFPQVKGDMAHLFVKAKSAYESKYETIKKLAASRHSSLFLFQLCTDANSHSKVDMMLVNEAEYGVSHAQKTIKTPKPEVDLLLACPC